MGRPIKITDNTEVKQYLLQLDLKSFDDYKVKLPSWLADVMVGVARQTTDTSDRNLVTDGTAWSILRMLRELDSISTETVMDYLSRNNMGTSKKNVSRWRSKLENANSAILFHGERRIFDMGVEPFYDYIEVDKCFEDFPDDPNNPAPTYTEDQKRVSVPIKRESLDDVLSDIEARFKDNKPIEITSRDRHIWNLKNGYTDKFLANQHKKIILLEDEIVVDTSTGEVL